MEKLVALAIVGLFVIVTGCAQLLKIQGQAAEKTAQGIDQYCANTDKQFRDKLRADINEKLAQRNSKARIPDQGICGE